MQIKDLWVGYPHAQPLLRLEEFHIPLGSCIALVGKNGSGKSTFLQTLSGLQAPIKGAVFINSKSLHTYSLPERAACLSFFKTLPAIGFGLTVKDLIHINPLNRTLLGTKDPLYQSILEDLQLHQVLNEPLSRLSDGWYQKALIARAFIQNTPYVIMDEPTLYLDVFAKKSFFLLIQKACRIYNRTIIFSTHDLLEMESYTDAVWTVEQERLNTYNITQWLQTGKSRFMNNN